MPRKYQNSVVLSDGRKVGYGLFRRGDTWYVRFVDGSGARVKKSLGEIPVTIFTVVKRGQKRNEHLRQVFRQQKIEEIARDVIRLTYISGRIALLKDDDVRRQLAGGLEVAKTPSAIEEIEKELRIHERLEQPLILD